MARLVTILGVVWVCKMAVISLIGSESAPANDNFSAATAVEVGVAVTNRFITATVEPGEPNSAGYKTLWYSFTAPESGSFVVVGELSPANGYIAIYKGTEVTNLTRLRAFEFSSRFIDEKRVSFRAEAGVTYKVAFGIWPVVGERTVKVQVLPGHLHDDLACAYELAGLFAIWTNKVTDATTEATEELVGAWYTPSIWAMGGAGIWRF